MSGKTPERDERGSAPMNRAVCSTGLLTVLMGVVGWTGCGQESLWFPETVQESKHVALGRFDNIKMCDGWLERMDLFIEDIAGQLGISVPTEKIPVSVLKYEMTTEYCNEDPVAGCYLRDAATDAPHLVVAGDNLISIYHELVHFLVIEWGEADGHGFYDEGMAESLAEDSSGAEYTTTKALLRNVLDDPGSLENRLRLNVFFKHLFSVYGVPKVLEWGRALKRDESETTLLEAFEQVFGKSLEAEWNTEWFMPENMYAASAQCLVPKSEDTGIPWHHRFTEACDGEPMSYVDVLTTQRYARVDIETAGEYLVFEKGRGIIWFTACSPTAAPVEPYTVKRHFEAGTYVVDVTFREGDEEAEVSIVPVTPCDPMNDACPDAEKCYYMSTDNSAACYPQSGPLLPEGAACEFSDAQSPDDCDKGLRCIFGFCRPTCKGTVLEPRCEENQTCFFENPVQPFTGYAYGLPGICAQSCNPLEVDCPPEQHCLWSPLNDEFVCGNRNDETAGNAGDTECVLTSCQQGLYCHIGEDNEALGVCVPLCDRTVASPDDTCPEGAAVQACVPHPSLPDIGYCQYQ